MYGLKYDSSSSCRKRQSRSSYIRKRCSFGSCQRCSPGDRSGSGKKSRSQDRSISHARYAHRLVGAFLRRPRNIVLTRSIGYGMVYYDKAILGSATLFGMTSDLALSVKDYSTSPPTVDTSRLSWATSIFYFGMLAGLYPMTFILQRFNVRTVLGPVVLIWAIVCAATAGVSTWQGLYVQRFFLGLYFLASWADPSLTVI